jgi:hypothetical protein
MWQIRVNVRDNYASKCVKYLEDMGQIQGKYTINTL